MWCPRREGERGGGVTLWGFGFKNKPQPAPFGECHSVGSHSVGSHKGPLDTPQKGHGLDLVDDTATPRVGGDGPRPNGLSELVYEALSYLCMRP